MNVADTVAITLVVLAVLLSFQGLWLFCRALWPSRVIAAATRCGRNPVKSFLAGVVVTVAMLVASGVAGQLGGPGQALSFGIVSLYVIFSGVGVAGLVTHMGHRLTSPADDRRPWAATVRGGVVLELAYLTPLVGQFVILPASVILGAGAATLALLRPHPARVATLPPPLGSAYGQPSVGAGPYTTGAAPAHQQPLEVTR